LVENSFGSKQPPHDTSELRRALKDFFLTPWPGEPHGKAVGSFRWGVYIFYDYDGEPIYVGQTNEKISGRIGRHLTNQRTDAVAMSVLDPFEVAEIEVFPLPDFENIGRSSPNFTEAKILLDALEYAVHRKAIDQSQFRAILNEKDPLTPEEIPELPLSIRRSILTDKVRALRDHADVRIARRAATIARLTQTIAERQVNVGLRRTLVVQADRLRWLAQQRFAALGGDASVPRGEADDASEHED
jgi:hypothetical protein